jgi:PKD repeat protein
VFQYAFWNAGEYTVKLTVDNGGCTLTKTKIITVSNQTKSGGDSDNGDKDGGKGDEIYVIDTPEKPLYQAPATITEAIIIPNPTDGDFQLKAKLEHPSRLIARLYSVTGQVVASFVIPEQTEDVLYQCNFTSLPAGVYMLQLLSDNDMRTLRIVINK